MPLNLVRARQCIRNFDFKSLFVEELGWDRHRLAPIGVELNGERYQLNALVEKRGFVVFICDPASRGNIPDRSIRLKIERQAAKAAHEHLIIFVDASKSTQTWQWIKRTSGGPKACREETYHTSQSGEALLQKLQNLIFVIDEEGGLTITEVAGRVRQALDVDRVTKRFYDRFKAEHTAFLKFIKGIQSEADLQWYTSLMLNRLMFVYFIQKKGFLDDDPDYLRNRLAMVRQAQGKDKFQSFYRYFLLRLFHEGLGKSPEERKLNAAMEKLLGRVPYLNGGFFEVHQLEEQNPDIDIPDKAFEKLFDFFDQYRWHLDERPLRSDNEINPDVVGYIFEKYINQKQMGAYYTKEDITEYISKNTIIPFLFNAAEKKYPAAFKSNADSGSGVSPVSHGQDAHATVWHLLQEDPDRYIYPAVRHGVIRPNGSLISETDLPDFVQKGMHYPKARMHDRRYNLEQAPKDDSIRLVTETWREYISRRNRCLEIREKLHRGEVHQINDLITLNLDIWQFARDAIVNSEGPELLRAFWHTIEKVTVLDPTCGSGAFLFAGLRILETLYSDCLERMERFVEESGTGGTLVENNPALSARLQLPATGVPPVEVHGQDAHATKYQKYSDFRKVLAQIATHPSERYFILKSIIINNLFGVDIMEEAVEICKLRLFLKLVAQVEKVEDIEPLPDIDFNIRAGNTLVGFVSLDQVRKSFQNISGRGLGLVFEEEEARLRRIEEDAEMVERAFQQFRDQQTIHGGKVTHNDKLELRTRLAKLDAELDRYLAGEYGINVEKQKDFDAWKANHEPFHWFVEFYGIMHAGGFDVIIGNPPYVVYSEGSVEYRVLLNQFYTQAAKNLYAFVFERSATLAQKTSPVGLIVQLTAISSERLASLQNLLAERGVLVSVPFPRRPESVFEGVEMPVVILLSLSGPTSTFTSTRINRFYTEERPTAMELLSMVQHGVRLHNHRIAKCGQPVDLTIYDKIDRHVATVDSLTAEAGEGVLYYQEACRYWLKAFDKLPFFARNGKRMAPPHGRVIHFRTKNAASFVACLLNSSLFYWYYSVFADCEHVNDVLLRTLRLPTEILTEEWQRLATSLLKRLEETASRKTIKTKQGHTIQYDEMKAMFAKQIIDEIDHVLAKHYSFTDEELDFIVNYDIKYRMGADADGALEE